MIVQDPESTIKPPAVQGFSPGRPRKSQFRVDDKLLSRVATRIATIAETTDDQALAVAAAGVLARMAQVNNLRGRK